MCTRPRSLRLRGRWARSTQVGGAWDAGEQRPELGDRWAPVGFWREAAVDRPGQLDGHAAAPVDGLGDAMELRVFVGLLLGVAVADCEPAGGGFPERDAETPDVGSHAELVAAGLLRGHVAPGARAPPQPPERTEAESEPEADRPNATNADAIARRALEISHRDDAGTPEENWLRAEQELRGNLEARGEEWSGPAQTSASPPRISATTSRPGSRVEKPDPSLSKGPVHGNGSVHD
jgi:hypothetical protein